MSAMSYKKISMLTSIIVTSAILGLSPLGLPAYAIDPCPSNITENTVLDADCEGGISIDADNIKLDCKGHTITGDGTGPGILLDGRTGVTIKHCNVTNFFNGFYLSSSSDNELKENTASENHRGFQLDSSSDNTLKENTASENEFGFLMDQSTDNTLKENTASENEKAGFRAEDSSDSNELTENIAYKNGGHGFLILNSDDNLLTENTSTENDLSGFRLQESASGNTLTENTSSSNGEYGYSDNTSGAGTESTANTYVENTCYNNIFGGSDPSGLCSPQI